MWWQSVLVVFLCVLFLWFMLSYGVKAIVYFAVGTVAPDESVILPPAAGLAILLLTLFAPVFAGFVVALAAPNRPFGHAVALIGC